jgi:hypothetical protein
MQAPTHRKRPAGKSRVDVPTGSLVSRPLLVAPGGNTCLKLYPTAGEATVTHAPARSRGAAGARRPLGDGLPSAPCVAHGTRAKGRIRRYTRANRLRFLWTLTYGKEPRSRKQVTQDLRRFFRRLAATFGRLPLAVVIETGSATGRLHVHFAAPRFLSYEKVKRAWGHGIVDVGDPRKLPGRVPPRRLAAYLAKYVAKQAGEVAQDNPKDRAKGEHRYLVTQGFTPVACRGRYRSAREAKAHLHRLYGQPDVVIPFGNPDVDLIYGVWCSFPDHLLHRQPRPT